MLRFWKHHARHRDFRRGKLGNMIILSNGSVLGDVLNQCLQKTLEHYRKHRSAEVHLLIQRPGFRPTKSFWSPLTPNAIPKLNSPPLSTALATRSEFQASQNDFEDGDDFAKPRKWCRKKFDAFACVQLAAKLDVAIGAAPQVLPLGCPELDNSSISSDRSWLQPPKTVVASTQPCSMSSVINSFPCVLIGRTESHQKKTQEFSQNAATSSVLKAKLVVDIASVSAIPVRFIELTMVG